MCNVEAGLFQRPVWSLTDCLVERIGASAILELSHLLSDLLPASVLGWNPFGWLPDALIMSSHQRMFLTTLACERP